MREKKALFLANSVYQLFTAIHMARNLLDGGRADLMVTDVTPGLPDYAPRLRKTGLFDRVIVGRTGELNRKYAAGKDEELTRGYAQFGSALRWMLNEPLDSYTQVYFSNFDPFTRMLACYFYEAPCEFLWYEDGFSSYVIDYLREDRAPVNRHPDGRKIGDKVKCVLLYEPRLAMRGDRLINRPLPKVSREDEPLRAILNFVFDYRRPERNPRFIFLEQSFRAEGLKNNDLALMNECQQAAGAGRFVVKPHPRNPENVPFQLGLTRKYAGNAPWELLLLNEPAEDKVLLTVCSNAALTGRLVFGADIPTVMLYRLFDGRVLWKEDAVLQKYLETFRREFAGKNYYVPKTIYELRNILHYLGGRCE